MLKSVCLALKQRTLTFLGGMPKHGTRASVTVPSACQHAWCQLRSPPAPHRSPLHHAPSLYHYTTPAACVRHTRCFATAGNGVATYKEQEAVQKFTHSLSEEQAAAALAGDGHLRYSMTSIHIPEEFKMRVQQSMTAVVSQQPCLYAFRIIAGPGSGKTRVLTSRVEYLIREKGCKPWEMVVITFSNKAARELQDRLAVLLGQDVAGRVIAGQAHC